MAKRTSTLYGGSTCRKEIPVDDLEFVGLGVSLSLEAVFSPWTFESIEPLLRILLNQRSENSAAHAALMPRLATLAKTSPTSPNPSLSQNAHTKAAKERLVIKSHRVCDFTPNGDITLKANASRRPLSDIVGK
jgi:hypothetical protein